MTGRRATGHPIPPFELAATERAPADWPDLVARDPLAEYTQTVHWTETACTHLPGAAPLWLTVRMGGRLVAGLAVVVRRIPRLAVAHHRWDSSYEGTSGGPVVAADLDPGQQDRVFGLLVDALAARRRGLLATCTVALSPEREERCRGLMAARPAWTRREVPTALVSLSGGIEQVDRQRLSVNKRNERNRSLRRGVEVFTTYEAGLLEQYYGIYDRAAAHWGIEPVPLPLLRDLLADPDQRVFFVCVRLEGKVIGGHLNLHLGRKVLAWNGVSDPAYARRYFPGTTCFWGDLQEACRRSAAWLDLGGSGDLKSLAGFKKNFGAELRTRGFYVNDSPAVRLLSAGKERWRGGRQATATRWHDSVTKADGRRS